MHSFHGGKIGFESEDVGNDEWNLNSKEFLKWTTPSYLKTFFLLVRRAANPSYPYVQAPGSSVGGSSLLFLALLVDMAVVPKSWRGPRPGSCQLRPPAQCIPLGGKSNFSCHSPGLTLLVKGTAVKEFPFRTHTICKES